MSALLQLLPLLTKIPNLLTILHQLILFMEQVFPNATGAQKLDQVIQMLQAFFPAAITPAVVPALQAGVSAVVSLAKLPGGSMADSSSSSS